MKMIFLLVLKISFFLWINKVVGEKVFKIGTSGPLTGTSQWIGKQIYNGIDISIKQERDRGGFPAGVDYSFEYLDDSYDPSKSRDNTKYFIENDFDFLLCYFGTPTTRNMTDLVIENGIPLVATLSGDIDLRNTSSPYIINVRTGYYDEVESLIKYLLLAKQRFQFSVFYQEDSYGWNGLNSTIETLKKFNTEIVSKASYRRNTYTVSEIEEAVDEIAKGNPDAVLMIGTYDVCALFTKILRSSDKFNSDVNEISIAGLSSVGTVEFIMELEKEGVGTTNIFLSEVTPYYKPGFDAFLLRDFNEAVTKYSSLGDGANTIAFESYLGFRFLNEVFKHVAYGGYSKQGFIDSVFSFPRNFLLGSELIVGGYEEGECNQGIRGVFPVMLNSSYEPVYDYEAESVWDGCYYDISPAKNTIHFKQSACFSLSEGSHTLPGDKGRSMKTGLQCGFGQVNRKNMEYDRPERVVMMNSKDDAYNPDSCLQNTKEFLEEENTFGLIGYVGSPTTEAVLPYLFNSSSSTVFLAAMTGLEALRVPGMDHVVNIRSSYWREIFTSVQYFVNSGKRKFSIVYQDDAFGRDCLVGFDIVAGKLGQAAMNVKMRAPYDFYDSDEALVKIARKVILDREQVVVFVGTDDHLVDFLENIKIMIGRQIDDMYFYSVSFVDTEELLTQLRQRKVYSTAENLYVSQVVPNWNGTTEVAKRFRREMSDLGFLQVGFTSFEGYIAGRFVSTVLDGISDEEVVTPLSFLRSIYNKREAFQIDDFQVGPFYSNVYSNLSSCNNADDTNDGFCNTGVRDIWITHFPGLEIEEVVSSPTDVPFQFDTCSDLSIEFYRPFFVGNVGNYDQDENMRDMVDAATISKRSYVPNILIFLKRDSTEESFGDIIEEYREIQVSSFFGFYDTSYYEDDGGYLPLLGPLHSCLDSEDTDNVAYKMVYQIKPSLRDEIRFLFRKYDEKKGGASLLCDENFKLLESDRACRSFVDSYHCRFFDSKSLSSWLSEYYTDSKKDFIHGRNLVVLTENTTWFFEAYESTGVELKGIHSINFLSNVDLTQLSSFKKISTPTYLVNWYNRKTNSEFKNFESESSTLYSYLDLQRLDIAFYGYVVGKLIQSVFLEIGNNFTSEYFVQQISEYDEFCFGNECLDFSDGCTIGSSSLYMYDIIDEKVSKFKLDWICPRESDVDLTWLIPVLGVVLLICCLYPLCCIVLFIVSLCCSFGLSYECLKFKGKKKLKKLDQIAGIDGDEFIFSDDEILRKKILDYSPLEEPAGDEEDVRTSSMNLKSINNNDINRDPFPPSLGLKIDTVKKNILGLSPCFGEPEPTLQDQLGFQLGNQEEEEENNEAVPQIQIEPPTPQTPKSVPKKYKKKKRKKKKRWNKKKKGKKKVRIMRRGISSSSDGGAAYGWKGTDDEKEKEEEENEGEVETNVDVNT